MAPDSLPNVTHCPVCETDKGQTYKGERYNPVTGMDGQWKCEKCTCEYLVKWHGRIVVIKPGLTGRELDYERMRFQVAFLAGGFA